MHKIKQMRLQAGMSQSQLAEKSGISVRVLQNYEAEGTAHRDFDRANLNTILRVCIALGCSLENIIESAEVRQMMYNKIMEEIQKTKKHGGLKLVLGGTEGEQSVKDRVCACNDNHGNCNASTNNNDSATNRRH